MLSKYASNLNCTAKTQYIHKCTKDNANAFDKHLSNDYVSNFNNYEFTKV